MGNPKAFLTIDRKEAGYRPKEERIRDYGEVEQTLAIEDRMQQASRCMDCGVPFCHWACPLGNRMPEYQDLVYKGKWKEAYQVLNQTHPFPEFTGRICPALCEKSCVQALEHQAVTIRENECATAERAYNEGFVLPRIPAFRNGRKVAIVGGGPAGLAAADRLNQMGYTVTVFEKNEAIGGLLRFGIPDFKLNKHVIDRRLEILEAEGITFKTGVKVAEDGDMTPKQLDKEFDAIVLTMGAETPRDLKVENRDVKGVYFALQLLQQQNRVNAGVEFEKADRITAKGKNVLIIGGGDTGSDCVGTSNRQGAKSVTQIEVMPKPFEDEDPVNPWPAYPRLLLKTTSSHKEGCTREWSLNTLRFVLDDNGNLCGAEVEKVDWVTPADGGRPNMVPTGEKKIIPCELALLAMGFTQPNAQFVDAFKLEKDQRGNIATSALGQTSNPKIFAAGDCRTGASLVVRAIASGRCAAQGVEEYFSTLKK
ncbi:MAG: glutamate synthase subunit beta [Bacteroidales bacterium]|nr:glutamate synthase subunit beta [Bacteroidales bacterium]